MSVKQLVIMGLGVWIATPFYSHTSAPATAHAPLTMKYTVPDSLPKGITVAYLMGKFDPAHDNRFEQVQPPYSSSSMYIRREALAAFIKMRTAAQQAGISLQIVSATRTFDAQKAIWEGKWNGKRPVDGKLLPPEKEFGGKQRALAILRWSSMPGTSRHHWGTDIDINSVEPDYWASTHGTKEYDWLVQNAHLYGFCQTYTPIGKQRPTGYQEEKWHWSYTPISNELTRAYRQHIKDKDITGFAGASTASNINVVKNYVLGINLGCL